MSLTVDIAWLLVVVLVSVRIAAAIAFVPVFGPASVPAPAKVIVSIVLATFMVSTLDSSAIATSLSLGGFVSAVFGEVIIGSAFAFGFAVANAATLFAGRVLDIQLGFGAASVLNPATQTPAPLVGSLFSMVMITAFLALDGHHVLIKALAVSLNSMPPAALSGEQTTTLIANTFEQSGLMFVYGLAFAAPVMFLLWLADVAMAVFARSMPQLNVFLLSFAVKIVLGIVGLALTIGIVNAILGALFTETYRYWDGVTAP